MKESSINFCKSLLGGLGLIWLLFESYYGLNPVAFEDRIGFTNFLLTGAILGILWFIVDGLFVSGYLKRSIILQSNAFDTPIKIMFGDLFRQDGCKAIPVNAFFDSTVDGGHVSEKSLHGMMLKKYWSGNTRAWDDHVAGELKDIPPSKVLNERPPPGKQKQYPIGSTARTLAKNQEFLCVALANTDIGTLKASASTDDLIKALHGLLRKARLVCSGNTLNIPLLGSGLAGIGIKPNIIVDLILLVIFEESKRQKIANRIRIVLPKDKRSNIDLTTIEKDWR